MTLKDQASAAASKVRKFVSFSDSPADEDDVIAVHKIHKGVSFCSESPGAGADDAATDDDLSESDPDNEEPSVDDSDEVSMFSISTLVKRTSLLALLVFILGCFAVGGFIGYGTKLAHDDVKDLFERRAQEVTQVIDTAFRDYETAALQTHNICRRSQNSTRQEFREFYQYLVAGGLEFTSTQCNINVTNEERPAYEAETRAFVEENYPHVDYKGFHSRVEEVRSEAPFHFVVHYLEPFEGNEKALDLDTYVSTRQAAEINRVIETRKPVSSGRLRIIQEQDDGAYTVIIYHPGIELDTSPEAYPREMGVILVRIPFLLNRVAARQEESLGVYLYDTTFVNTQGEQAFLGAAEFRVNRRGSMRISTNVTIIPEIDYDSLMRQQGSRITYEEEVNIASGTWNVVVVPIDDSYEPKVIFVVFGGVMIFMAAVGLPLWMFTNMRKVIQVYKTKRAAQAESSIIKSLFPASVLDRLKRDAEHRQEVKRARAKQLKFGAPETPTEKNLELLPRNGMLTSEELFGSKPIADFHPNVTIVCIDLAGFTAWSSVREPSQVLTLLEVIYHYFDLMARRRRIFKVEAVGDCYLAASGVPNARRDHAVAVARYATACLHKFHVLVQELETNLGPSTGDLELRLGIHSGAVTAGVVRGDRGRFQLFGETVSTALAMEATGESSQIHVSPDTAELLCQNGKEHWLIPREKNVLVSGRGHVQTYWLQKDQAPRSIASVQRSIPSSSGGGTEKRPMPRKSDNADKLERLVRWNVAELSGLLKQILARRPKASNRRKQEKVPSMRLRPTKDQMPLAEVKDVIMLPKFDSSAYQDFQDPEDIDLPVEVVDQLTDFIRQIASMYRDNPFHNFEHASHVAMSVTKQLSRIKNPKELFLQQKEMDSSATEEDNDLELGKSPQQGLCSGVYGLHANLHDYTFGITSDPMTQFAAFFSAVIHDVDHPGVPNATMIVETPEMAQMYNEKSIAEQNSVDLSWDLLMNDEYQDLRRCLFSSVAELEHFRQLIVNMVMATDVMDKDLNALRKDRWNKAFSDPSKSQLNLMGKEDEITVNRKATIVIEHLIQASDVSHTMQHFHVYKKWNERLFMEMYHAFRQGRLHKDPSHNWYQGELGFLEFYVLPLAKKLDTCGVFGVSSEEFRFYAMENIREWKMCGKDLVASYLKIYEDRFGPTEIDLLPEVPEPSEIGQEEPSEVQEEDGELEIVVFEDKLPVLTID